MVDPTLAGIVAYLAYLAGTGGGAAAAWLYDRTLARLAYFADARVRAYLVPILASLIVAAAGAALIPAEALAGAAFAPLIDASLPFVLAAAGWQGAARALAAHS